MVKQLTADDFGNVLRLDPKNRIILAGTREIFPSETVNAVATVYGADTKVFCIKLCNDNTYQEIVTAFKNRAQISDDPISSETHHLLYELSATLRLDAQNRITLPNKLLNIADIKKEIVATRCPDYIRLMAREHFESLALPAMFSKETISAYQNTMQQVLG